MAPANAQRQTLNRDQAVARFKEAQEANKAKVTARRLESKSDVSKKRLENKNKIAAPFGMKFVMKDGRYVRSDAKV